MKNATTPVRWCGNALMQLNLYKNHTTWMFDDPAHQILAEPFVLGMSEIITERIPTNDRCTLLFSLNPFPGSHSLNLLNEEADGGWYREPELDMQGWLCPVTRVYCGGMPGKIHYRIFEPGS